ncbi:alpha/beta hydrolase [Rhodococcus sp. HM1]|uniref:alpha/beta fold hydrolase n=1 Tax=unclassified Rhodococcus (in: high G+C Gram-positive bacteria) TaxID=192944 RepID=UPI0018CDD399|nr:MULTISPECIES: alpha/beta hydrolase [unclassified Rhodococcus (in: high G+C Gram-positive bacteria)]MBH0119783.1 alpha/beta hydrolase [Rhodococcus sp. CX]MCK8672808.1 alpha/beta hydrolase [Rhodococcus sp. HM1]
MPGNETVVFLPGLNNSSSVWRQVIEALPAGIGGRAVDLPLLEDIDSIADTVVADLPEKFVLVGHSFGGYVTLSALERHPDRIRGIVLVNSSCRADNDQQRSTRIARIEQLTPENYEQIAMSVVDVSYHQDSIGPGAASAERLLAERRSMLREYGFERFVAHSRAAAHRPDRTDVLRTATAPVLVVAGDDDRVIPTPDQQAMALDVGASMRVLARAGHMLPAEQPDALADVLAEWLQKHSSATAH